MTEATYSASRRFRADIQALRGFAVLVVLFYHAKLSLFPAGYLGVDVFFVISGFLITTLIKNGIENGSFRFSEFYFRRAKRLLPAAYVTFLATALLAPFFLASSEMADFRAQMAGAVTFTANFVLWQQSGYFGGEAELKPLLHVWSLAIEEQYYFVLPALLMFVPRRLWLRVAMLIFAASLASCLLLAGKESTFYLLPTRAWELTIGSVGALMLRNATVDRLLRAAFWPALATVLVLPLVHFGRYHPGAQALLICAATLVVILRRHPSLSDAPVTRVLSRVGDMSYSLYLVHWPLFAFFNNVWVGEAENQQSSTIRIALMGLSLLLAFLLNRHVEEPIRRAEIPSRAPALALTLATSVGLVAASALTAHLTPGAKHYAQIRRINYGFAKACNLKKEAKPIPACRNSERPAMLIWGDSYAMHLVPGLTGVEQGAPGVVQITRSVCGPLLGVAGLAEDRGYDEEWGKSCVRFNESVIDYLKEAESIETIVLSSTFSQFLGEDRRLLVRDGGDNAWRTERGGLEPAVRGLKRTVDAVRAMGRRVVVVAPPPGNGQDSSRCLERLERDLPMLGAVSGCAITKDSYRKRRGKVLELLAALPQRAGVDVISFDSYLCDSELCRTYADGTFIYRDEGHLSREGSVFLANAVSLVEQIHRTAR